MTKTRYLIAALAMITATPAAAQQNARQIIVECALAAGFDGPFRIQSGFNGNGQYIRLGPSEGLDPGTRAVANSCAAGRGLPVSGQAEASGGRTIVFGDGGRRTVYGGGKRATVEVEDASVRVDPEPTVAVEAGGAPAPSLLFCPYPYRASDSVFANGSGYVTKDTVRQSLGCL